MDAQKAAFSLFLPMNPDEISLLQQIAASADYIAHIAFWCSASALFLLGVLCGLLLALLRRQ